LTARVDVRGVHEPTFSYVLWGVREGGGAEAISGFPEKSSYEVLDQSKFRIRKVYVHERGLCLD